jgi:hydroxymethylpyrimidine/phosphomethylpyrimidine kinase
LAIAGSDSGGGAGVQADLKAFARCGVHGATAITALTAQNTLGVEAVAAVPPEMIVAQVRAVADDLGVDAVKVGMLGDEPTIDAVVEALSLVGDAPVVVDPVMVAESGAELLEPAARAALIERVLPLATVATPNLAEARALSALGDAASPRELGEAILALGPGAVVVTGGHTESGADVLVDDSGAVTIEGPRYPAGASHGSGCTHSSALAAFLARGVEVGEAARWAREIAAEAVGNGLRGLGAGVGPVDALGIARRAGPGARPDDRLPAGKRSRES